MINQFKRFLRTLQFQFNDSFGRYHLNHFFNPNQQKDIRTVLMYHGIDNNPYHDLDIPLEAFKNEITFYRKQGYQVCDINDLDKISNQAKLVIVFDDGNRNIIPALNWLVENKLPFNIAICPNINNNNSHYWFDTLYYFMSKKHPTPLDDLKNQHRKAIESINQSAHSEQELIEQYGNFHTFQENILDDSFGIIHENLNTRELQTYIKTGFCSISIHGLNHQAMSRMTKEEFHHDIVECKQQIQKQLNINAINYVCPFGLFVDAYYDVIKDENIKHIFIINNRINMGRPKQDIYQRVKGIGLNKNNYGYYQSHWNNLHQSLTRSMD